MEKGKKEIKKGKWQRKRGKRWRETEGKRDGNNQQVGTRWLDTWIKWVRLDGRGWLGSTAREEGKDEVEGRGSMSTISVRH